MIVPQSIEWGVLEKNFHEKALICSRLLMKRE